MTVSGGSDAQEIDSLKPCSRAGAQQGQVPAADASRADLSWVATASAVVTTSVATPITGLVGMAAVFAGASHAPIAALVIVFELTGEYSIILPLMTAAALATGVSHLVSRRAIYTLKLLRRGDDIDADPAEAEAPPPTDAGPLQRITVADAMRPLPEPVDARADRQDLLARLADARYGALPVYDDSGYRGAVTAGALDDPWHRHVEGGQCPSESPL